MTMVPRSPTALVVYESMFGNTRQIAEAIAAVLSERGAVQLVEVSQAPLEVHDVDLLVVGGPTHALGMSRPSTRTGACEKGATGDVARGVREWLRGVTFVPRPALATAFDTHVRTRLPLGSARRPIARRLRRLGLRVAPSASFVVTSTPGPLEPGEVEAARRRAAQLEMSPVAV